MSDIPVALVAAVAANNVIGAAGGLPWRIKADLKRFRAITMGKPIVMGRKTFESLPRHLDGRDNIAVTRDAGFVRPGVFVASSIADALTLAADLALQAAAPEICVIGGGEIYAATMARASRLYITHVGVAPAGDVYFPRISPDEWQEIARGDLPFSESDTASAFFAVYQRSP
jgi:dihydrofolate reductase